ncbi:MAG: hypothetical protein ACXWRU_19355 [Pseudobdellovibrionaceae bacterium]
MKLVLWLFIIPLNFALADNLKDGLYFQKGDEGGCYYELVTKSSAHGMPLLSITVVSNPISGKFCPADGQTTLLRCKSNNTFCQIDKMSDAKQGIMGGIEKLSNSAFIIAYENCYKDKLQYPCNLRHPSYGSQYEFYSNKSTSPATIFTAESDGSLNSNGINISFFMYWVQNPSGHDYSKVVPPVDLKSVAQAKALDAISSICDRAKNQALIKATQSCLQYRGGIYSNADCTLYSSFQEGSPQVTDNPADSSNYYLGHFQVNCPTQVTVKVQVPISK